MTNGELTEALATARSTAADAEYVSRQLRLAMDAISRAADRCHGVLTLHHALMAVAEQLAGGGAAAPAAPLEAQPGGTPVLPLGGPGSDAFPRDH